MCLYRSTDLLYYNGDLVLLDDACHDAVDIFPTVIVAYAFVYGVALHLYDVGDNDCNGFNGYDYASDSVNYAIAHFDLHTRTSYNGYYVYADNS